MLVLAIEFSRGASSACVKTQRRGSPEGRQHRRSQEAPAVRSHLQNGTEERAWTTSLPDDEAETYESHGAGGRPSERINWVTDHRFRPVWPRGLVSSLERR